MKQLLILSGKGGTGKTTVACAFIRLAQAKAYADCDVDAPNLHLVMRQETEPQRTDYFGMDKAEIDAAACAACGLCMRYCRFDAIEADLGDGRCRIDPYACEGCGVCEAICPAGAISMQPAVAGELTLYAGADTAFSTAQLKMGSGTSGKLVTQVKKKLASAAPKDAELAIIDGSPGIGCPVIASMSGADMVLVVAEPSLSGISDMERILKTAEIFHTKAAVCVNKYDAHEENAERIEAFCKANGVAFTGKIPFDPQAVRAVNSARTVVDVDCPAGRAVRKVFENTLALLEGKTLEALPPNHRQGL